VKKISEEWLSVGLISLITLLTYGVLIPQLGFYRDDWYLFWTAQSQGPAGVIALFQIDRPLVGYLYALGVSFLGTSPLAWQLLTLAVRLLGNLASFYLLRLLWPERKVETTAIALLFSVYPGYADQPNAGVFVSDLLANAALLVSLVLTFKVVKSSWVWVKILLSILAGLLVLLYLGIDEYMIGIEVARFGLLWYFIWRQERSNFKAITLRAFKSDLMYLVIGGAFLVWRLVIFQSTRRATNVGLLLNKYSVLPQHSILSAGIENLKSILETIFFAWVVPFYQFTAQSNYRDLAAAVGLGFLAAVCVFLLLRLPQLVEGDAVPDPRPDLHIVWMGLIIVVFVLLPINITGRNVLFSGQWDRYTLGASLGAGMVVGGLIFHFFRGSARRVLLLVLIGMSVVVHYFSAAWYRDLWRWERDMWQQMVWRAPNLKPGTMLFAILPEAAYAEGYEIYGPANMVYYPHQGLQIGGEILNADTATYIQAQRDLQHYDRSNLIEDNYKSPLIVIYPGPQSCLHVLDGRKVELPGYIENSLVTDVAQYSQIGLVEPSAKPAVLPDFLAGEHPRDWCYYYQMMDLARQQGNWQAVAQLADEASNKGLTPEDVSEWMPALEAYATLNHLRDARHAAAIIRSNDHARYFLCGQLKRGPVYPVPYNYTLVYQLLCGAS
jgi:hypothetical protein